MSASNDLIVAPATPTGTSALAVVRVSGPGVRRLAAQVFDGATLEARVASHRCYRREDGQIVDDVVATLFVEPRSYTGEDLLELSTHGNPLLVQMLITDLVARGCRLAEPGEFTRRAFLHGRLDLAQAEAVMDVIHARSERALAVARKQLEGGLGRQIEALLQRLIAVVARVEAYIDFPEEDLPAEDVALVQAEVGAVLRGTQRLLATQRYGELLREGLRTVLLGQPNVGKSSLLNALLGRERALVSPEPGTTRDYLEDSLVIGGHLVRLVDTAGLNVAPGELERRGIQKTLERAQEADLFLIVLEATPRPKWPDLPAALQERLTPDNTIVVLNKCDLSPAGTSGCDAIPYPIVRTSAMTGAGLEELNQAVAAVADKARPEAGEDVVAINARHAGALDRAVGALRAVQQQITEQRPAELIAANLRDALDALGEIGGRVDHERVLDTLFATFCIGK